MASENAAVATVKNGSFRQQTLTEGIETLSRYRSHLEQIAGAMRAGKRMQAFAQLGEAKAAHQAGVFLANSLRARWSAKN